MGNSCVEGMCEGCTRSKENQCLVLTNVKEIFNKYKKCWAWSNVPNVLDAVYVKNIDYTWKRRLRGHED